MTAKRKPKPLPEPTVNQLDEAMLAFEKLRMRYRLEHYEDAPPDQRFVVRVVPEMLAPKSVRMGAIVGAREPAYTVHRFGDEASARRWREREIIREAIAAGMRAHP